MSLSDAYSVLHWWFVIFGIGIATFPIAFTLLNSFWDKGWGFAKILGIGLLSYWVWIVGSLHVLSFSKASIWLGILLLAAVSYFIWQKKRKELLDFLKNKWRLIVFEEVLFFILLLFWSWVRAHQPDINGLEKFMDFGFVNSILRTKFFPPPDMWLAGETINYYYFGHLVTAVLTKLSGISSALTYNLMIATLMALSFIATFSLGGTLISHLIPKVKSKWYWLLLAGLISALVFVFGGNLHAVYKITTEGAATYWYPDATRFIPYTIHEFPLYSFVVSDLHSHVNDIPFVLLVLALILNFLKSIKLPTFSFDRSFLFQLGFLGLFVGIMYMTSALDAFIYLSLFGLIFFISIIGKYSGNKAVILSLTVGGIVSLFALLFSFPFHLSFSPFAKGINFVQARSSFGQLLVLWGFFLFVGFVFLLLFKLQRLGKYRKKHYFSQVVGKYIIAIIGFSFLLVVVPEIVYIQDIYIKEYHRANTMFKLVYQTFLMMSVISGPVFVSTFLSILFIKVNNIRLSLLVIILVFVIGLGSILTYPFFAIRSYYNRLQVYQGLDGLSWLKRKYPDDYEAIYWLKNNISGQPVILEAVGESYTDYARVSANTGLPTVLGWRVHEWLWRGSFEEPGKRTGEVSEMYTSNDISQICNLINAHSIDLIFLGELERKQYKNLNENMLENIGDVLFSKGKTIIYSVQKPCGSS